MVNVVENKSKGLVKSKGERLAFLRFSFKKKIVFCKGAHGLGRPVLGRAWDFGYNRWTQWLIV